MTRRERGLAVIPGRTELEPRSRTVAIACALTLAVTSCGGDGSTDLAGDDIDAGSGGLYAGGASAAGGSAAGGAPATGGTSPTGGAPPQGGAPPDGGSGGTDGGVLAPPSAAASVTATSGGLRTSLISWTAPQDDGGSPITGYRVTSSPGGISVDVGAATTQLQVTGLADGTTYVFSVVATNAVGDGPAASSSSVTTLDVPGAPLHLSVSLTFGKATLTFDPPDDDGGSAVTDYVVTAEGPSGIVNAAPLTPTYGTPAFETVIDGLTDGEDFVFRVVAQNVVGDGPPITVSMGIPCVSLGLPGWPLLNKTDTPYYILNTFVEDFDGDGKLDVLGLSRWVTFYAGHGDGRFDRGVESPTEVIDLGFSGDIDGDGDLDLLGLAASHEVFTYLNDGAGHFTPAPAGSLAISGGPTAGALGDLDGNGKLDAVAVAGSTYSVLLGAGNGSYPQRADTVVTGVTFSAAELGYLDADANLDLVLTGASGGGTALHVLLGNGDGTFQPAILRTTGEYQGADIAGALAPTQLRIADLNGDLKADVVAVGKEATIGVHLGNGDGTLQPVLASALYGTGAALTLADVNGDLKLDAVVGIEADFGYDGMEILLGSGSGTFVPSASLPTVNAFPRSVAVGDLDGDTLPDVVSGPRYQDGPQPFRGLGDGTFAVPTTAPVPFTGMDAVVVSLAPGEPSSLVVLGFVPEETPPYGFADEIAVYTPDPTGAPGTPTVSTVSSHSQLAWREVVAAKVDGDADVDLLVAGPLSFGALLNDGTGSFTAAPAKAFVSGGSGAHLAACDVDGNGAVDVVVNTGTELDVFPGNGAGGFGVAYVVVPANGMANPHVGCADLDGDGNVDLVAPGGGRSTLVLRGNGDFTFQLEVTYASTGFTNPPLLRDITGDGYLDIIHDSDIGPSVLVNDGTGSFLLGAGVQSGWSWSWDPGQGTRHTLAAADMDGDGNEDIVLSGVFGTIGVLLGNGDGAFPFQVGFPSGHAGLVSGVADVDGDGRPDVLSLVSAGYSASPSTVSVALNRTLAGCY